MFSLQTKFCLKLSSPNKYLHNIFWLNFVLSDSRYLVKLDIPPEVSADMDVSEVYQQYEQLITEFTLVHKESEDIKNSGYSTAELR